MIGGQLVDLAPVHALLSRGDALGAVKYIQQQSGCSLRDAKAYVDALRFSVTPDESLHEPPEGTPAVIYGWDKNGYYKKVSGVRSPVYDWELPPDVRARLETPPTQSAPSPLPEEKPVRGRVLKKVLLTLALFLCSGALLLLVGLLNLPLRGSRGFSGFAMLVALPAVIAVFVWLPFDQLRRQPDGIRKALLILGASFLAILAVMGAFLLCCLAMARFVWHTI